MKDWQVGLITAFGRGETLALALHENGFQVQVLDFTSAFPEHYHRGPGPFPVIDHPFIPAQREFLNHLIRFPKGLSLWMDDGPLELSGPMSEVHRSANPELKALKSGATSGEFAEVWLERFLRQWASPFYAEPWVETSDARFPYDQPLGVVPAPLEARVMNVDRLHSKAIEIRNCVGFLDVRLHAQRIVELEVDCGSAGGVQANQWIWCLSSSETKKINAAIAEQIFFRGIAEPEWAWISFEGSMEKGAWCDGLPKACVVIGDAHLPWTYANAVILRRIDDTQLRYWMKVPRNRIDDIDVRRTIAQNVRTLLMKRLPLAEWKVDSAQWSLCPHSEIFSADQRSESPATWKNWDWISPETLPRLDMSARFEREAASFKRLIQWRNEQKKKQGARDDHSLHAP